MQGMTKDMQDKKYQVFISSTFKDLQEERRVAIEAVLITGNIPVGMESFVASSQEQFEYIKKCINNCDYYILIVGGCYGSTHPKSGISYTELEFDYAKSLNKPILIFFYRDIAELSNKDVNLENINKFRIKVQKENLCQPFLNKYELKGLILTALKQEIEKNPQVGWIRSDEIMTSYTKQKICISNLISTGSSLHARAVQHFNQTQQYGLYAGTFDGDYEFQVWIQKIIEFITQNDLSEKYLYKYSSNIPYVQIIKEQLIKLEGLFAAYEYKEMANK